MIKAKQALPSSVLFILNCPLFWADEEAQQGEEIGMIFADVSDRIRKQTWRSK
jgi:hypothetical protein